jgi:hypothetical protein
LEALRYSAQRCRCVKHHEAFCFVCSNWPAVLLATFWQPSFGLKMKTKFEKKLLVQRVIFTCHSDPSAPTQLFIPTQMDASPCASAAPHMLTFSQSQHTLYSSAGDVHRSCVTFNTPMESCVSHAQNEKETKKDTPHTQQAKVFPVYTSVPLNACIMPNAVERGVVYEHTSTCASRHSSF